MFSYCLSYIRITYVIGIIIVRFGKYKLGLDRDIAIVLFRFRSSWYTSLGFGF